MEWQLSERIYLYTEKLNIEFERVCYVILGSSFSGYRFSGGLVWVRWHCFRSSFDSESSVFHFPGGFYYISDNGAGSWRPTSRGIGENQEHKNSRIQEVKKSRSQEIRNRNTRSGKQEAKIKNVTLSPHKEPGSPIRSGINSLARHVGQEANNKKS